MYTRFSTNYNTANVRLVLTINDHVICYYYKKLLVLFARLSEDDTI